MLSAAWSAILPDATFEQVLLKIDSALLYTKQYEAELEVRIANLKSLQQHASSYEERYNICRQLVECYENYRADSTYHYIDCCKEMAVKVGRTDWLVSLNLYRIDVYLQMNMLAMAKDELKKMDEKIMNHSQRMTYYTEYHTLCVQTQKQPQALDAVHLHEYNEMAQYYLKKIYAEATLDDDYCKYLLMNRYTEQKRLPEMIAYYEGKMKNISGMSEREIAENAGILFDLNSYNHNEAQMYAWLAYAMEYSFHHAIRDYGPRLIAQLIERGDTDRAYRYIGFLLMQVVHYPDHRNLTVLPNYLNEVYKVTNETNLRKIQSNKRSFLVAVFVAVVLLIFSMVTVWLVRKLARQRRQLAEKHCQLLASQQDLQRQMKETYRTAQLLEKANRQKEAYIGQIFLLSNKNISKIEELRLTIYRLLKVGKNNEALNITQKKESLWANELKVLEGMFDETFLSIYPGFVNDFNSLLRDEEHYTLNGETLNTDLRIYALVWLGINNSQKIANLLHLAPKTVYNIRLKVRSKALPSEEDFPLRVWRLNRTTAIPSFL